MKNSSIRILINIFFIFSDDTTGQESSNQPQFLQLNRNLCISLDEFDSDNDDFDDFGDRDDFDYGENKPLDRIGEEEEWDFIEQQKHLPISLNNISRKRRRSEVEMEDKDIEYVYGKDTSICDRLTKMLKLAFDWIINFSLNKIIEWRVFLEILEND